MSTRRLIITALVCGLAILVAGGIQLFRLADDERIELPGLGESRVVEGVRVSVESVRDLGSITVVEVELQAVGTEAAGVAGGDGWSLLRGTITSPVEVPEGAGTPCASIVVAETGTACVVAFDAPVEGDRYLAYRRGDVEARWALDG